jgi:hypothetical protein
MADDDRETRKHLAALDAVTSSDVNLQPGDPVQYTGLYECQRCRRQHRLKQVGELAPDCTGHRAQWRRTGRLNSGQAF